MKTEDFVRVGSIIKPHGLKGAVKVYPTTDEEEAVYAKGTSLLLDLPEGTKELTVKNASRFKNIFIVTFEEFSDINEVEAFRGCDLLIEKLSAEELGEGVYYYGDLIGLSVVDEDGSTLGILSEVIETGANDVYNVKREGEKDLLIPAIPDCIRRVDLEEGVMEVHLLKGLLP